MSAFDLTDFFTCTKGSDATCTSKISDQYCCSSVSVVFDGDVSKMDSALKTTLITNAGFPEKSSDGEKFICLERTTLTKLEQLFNLIPEQGSGIVWKAYCASATKVTASIVAAGAMIFASSF